MVPREPKHSDKIRLIDWSVLRTRLVWAYRGEPSAPHFSSPEYASTIAWLVEKGAVQISGRRSGSVECTAGHWVFPAVDKINHDFSSGSLITSVRFAANWPEGGALFDGSRTIVIPADRCGQLNVSTRRLVRTVKRSSDGRTADTNLLETEIGLNAYLQLHRATIDWIGAYCRVLSDWGVALHTIGHQDERVVRVKEMIDHLPPGAPLDEKMLARRVNISVSQLNRLFVAAIGMSVRAFAEKRRLQLARDLLLASPTSVKGIAFQLGFRHSSHFSAWFHKHLGFYPSAFREMKNLDITRALG